jgi:hypothetical protein
MCSVKDEPEASTRDYTPHDKGVLDLTNMQYYRERHSVVGNEVVSY